MTEIKNETEESMVPFSHELKPMFPAHLSDKHADLLYSDNISYNTNKSSYMHAMEASFERKGILKKKTTEDLLKFENKKKCTNFKSTNESSSLKRKKQSTFRIN